MKSSRVLLTMLTLLSPPLRATATADYYRCTGRVAGEWNYGDAPQACNASAFGNTDFILQTYDEIIFLTAAENREAERARYTQEMYAVIRDAANYYIHLRNPKVSAEESDW